MIGDEVIRDLNDILDKAKQIPIEERNELSEAYRQGLHQLSCVPGGSNVDYQLKGQELGLCG